MRTVRNENDESVFKHTTQWFRCLGGSENILDEKRSMKGAAVLWRRALRKLPDLFLLMCSKAKRRNAFVPRRGRCAMDIDSVMGNIGLLNSTCEVHAFFGIFNLLGGE